MKTFLYELEALVAKRSTFSQLLSITLLIAIAWTSSLQNCYAQSRRSENSYSSSRIVGFPYCLKLDQTIRVGSSIYKFYDVSFSPNPFISLLPNSDLVDIRFEIKNMGTTPVFAPSRRFQIITNDGRKFSLLKGSPQIKVSPGNAKNYMMRFNLPSTLDDKRPVLKMIGLSKSIPLWGR